MIWRRLTLASILDVGRAPLALPVVTGLVVVSIAVGAAGLVWRLSGLDDGRDRIALARTGPGPSASTDIMPILNLAPFGAADAGVEVTASGMILKAVFMAYPAEASSAVISVGESPPTPVRPGQTLTGGAVVQSIGIDHVVLLVGGQTERLAFPKPPDTPSGDEATAPVAPPPPPGPAPAPTARAAAPAPSGGAGMVPSVVETYRQRLAGNPQGVAAELGITASAAGFRVGDNPPAELRAAGLRAGDLVEKVNNQPVGTLANARDVLDQAIVSGGARVEVIRDGRRLTLSFPLR